MNVDKDRVLRRFRGTPEVSCGRDGAPADADRENVLDLIAVIEDERRFHAAAADRSHDPLERERYRALAREAAALLANIRHGLARIALGQLSRRQRAREMERYACSLMARSLQSRRHRLSSNCNMQGAR